MKLKYLIIALSFTAVITLLLTVLLPILLLGPGTDIGLSVALAINSRYVIIPLLVLMVLFLGSMGIFFFFNYRLFSLLEREDWPALAYYLEQKIYVKGKYSSRNVRLLASSYLVTSDYQSVLKLEGKVQLNKPSLIVPNVLIFGAARVLSGKNGEAADFFKMHLEKSKLNAGTEQWVHWFYGFSQLLSGAYNDAKPEFMSLAASSNNALITGLSAYFLHSSVSKYSGNTDECLAAAANGKERVVSALKNAGNWKKEADKLSTDIHVAIIIKYINGAGTWLFSG